MSKYIFNFVPSPKQMSEIILGQPFYLNDNNTSRRAVRAHEDGKRVFSEY